MAALDGKNRQNMKDLGAFGKDTFIIFHECTRIKNTKSNAHQHVPTLGEILKMLVGDYEPPAETLGYKNRQELMAAS